MQDFIYDLNSFTSLKKWDLTIWYFYKHWLFLLMTKVLFAVVLDINHTFIGGSFRAHIGKQRKANEVEKLTMWRIHSGSGCTQFLIRRLIIPLLTHDMVYALKFALDFAFIRFMQSEIYARKEKREKMQKISFSSNSSLVGIAKHHSTTKKGLPTYICKIKEVKMTIDKILPAHTKKRRKYWTNSDIEYRVSKSNPSLTLCSKLDSGQDKGEKDINYRLTRR